MNCNELIKKLDEAAAAKDWVAVEEYALQLGRIDALAYPDANAYSRGFVHGCKYVYSMVSL